MWIDGRYYPDPENVPPVHTTYWTEGSWVRWTTSQKKRAQAIKEALERNPPPPDPMRLLSEGWYSLKPFGPKGRDTIYVAVSHADGKYLLCSEGKYLIVSHEELVRMVPKWIAPLETPRHQLCNRL